MVEPTKQTQDKSTEIKTSNNDKESSKKDYSYSSKRKTSLTKIALYRSVITRFLLLYKHAIGIMIGGFVASVNALPPYRRKGLRSAGSRISAFIVRKFIKKEFRKQPFQIQLRRRLEILGPTYVKLGQIMAIREDLLPREVTDELKNLLDNLPEVPFDIIKGIIEENLEAPLKDLFIEVKEKPIGSASIGQIHRATTLRGRPVVIKVIKPGIRETILSDLKLLQILSHFLQKLIPQYQPKVIINEFCLYTEKEIDLHHEADHAELFAVNFSDNPNITFPKIYRELSTRDVLCMEYISGLKPTDSRVFEIYKNDLKKIVDLGVGALIKMLYQDGFFHADLHAANFLILPGPKISFLDLGMVGRFDENTKRRLLYYFYALVNGDIEGSTKHLMAIAKVDESGDALGFKRAVSDLFRRYLLRSAKARISMAQLILESLAIGGKYKVFFPVEMTLMVKALVTFEGVGYHLEPNLDIPKVSKKHIQRIFLNHYSPEYLLTQLKRGLPELIDMLIRLPETIADSSRIWNKTFNNKKQESPIHGVKSGLITGACIVGGVMAYVQGAHPALWISLFVIALIVFIFGKS